MKSQRLSNLFLIVMFLSVSKLVIGQSDSLALDSLSLDHMGTDTIEVAEKVVAVQSGLKEGQLVDGIIGVVGNSIILKSDIDVQRAQLEEQGVPEDKSFCYVWQQLLFQKLLVHKADIDSVEVTDKEVEFEMDRRLRYLLSQMGGSEMEFQKYFGKTVLQFKEEMQPIIKENLKAKKMQGVIAEKVSISPSEVESFYEKIPADSLPIIQEQYKIAQIILTPVPSSYEKERIRKELEQIREDIIKGKDFGLMALLHSQDPGSKTKKGELGFVSRDQLVPQFAAAAFQLQPGEISEIVESDYGYHIIQMIEKKGTYVNVRHILLSPKVYTTDIELCKVRVDSVVNVLKEEGSDFNRMATKVSDDERTAENGGGMVNYQTGDDYFTAEELDENLYFLVQNMKKGDMSNAEIVQLPGGKSAYRIIKLMDKVDFHTANIESDYDKIKQSALAAKKQKSVDIWIGNKLADTYLKLPAECEKCESLKIWSNQANQ